MPSWDRNAGKYDKPSSGVPTPKPSAPSPSTAPLDPDMERERYRGIVSIHDEPDEQVETVAGEEEAVETVEGFSADADSQRILRSIIERVENLDDQIADLRADRSDVLKEAKAQGFDRKALDEVLRRRKMDPEMRSNLDAVVETYEIALGGLGRGMVWGGDLRAHKALPAPKATDRSRRADETLAAILAADRAEQA